MSARLAIALVGALLLASCTPSTGRGDIRPAPQPVIAALPLAAASTSRFETSSRGHHVSVEVDLADFATSTAGSSLPLASWWGADDGFPPPATLLRHLRGRIDEHEFDIPASATWFIGGPDRIELRWVRPASLSDDAIELTVHGGDGGCAYQARFTINVAGEFIARRVVADEFPDESGESTIYTINHAD